MNHSVPEPRRITRDFLNTFDHILPASIMINDLAELINITNAFATSYHL